MIGRNNEVGELNRLYSSDKAQLVAIYGRRRIGKTYLVDETFKGRITFRHAGLSPVEEKGSGVLKTQLEHFYYSLQLHGMKKSHCPKSWLEAFFMLEMHLQSIDDGTRQVVFIDELPWLDTPRSGFLTAFEAFWNNWGCHRNNLMVIVCGSANSWILDNLINNHGGLYNRVTYEIKLKPFTLAECREYYKAEGILLSDYDVAQSYMILGGVPYYMGYFQRGKSLAQNIDSLFFASNGKLRDEFDRLFASAFASPETMKKIVEVLRTKNAGLSRKEVSAKTGIKDGGTLTKHLNALIASDFVTKYVPFGHSQKEEFYRLVDPFCIFYFRFIYGKTTDDEEFWKHNVSSQVVSSWRGYAFENLSFNHIDQIKSALGISGIRSEQSAWFKRDSEAGVQIDMLIDRNDNVINMCEMKFYSGEFAIDKEYHGVLNRRMELLSENIPKRKVIHSTLVTTYGLKYNEYSGDFVNVVTLEDMFQ